MITMGVWLGRLTGAAVLALVFVACSDDRSSSGGEGAFVPPSEPQLEVSWYADFASVESMVASSDLVVEGTVTGFREYSDDEGGGYHAEVRVTEALHGSGPTDVAIPVGVVVGGKPTFAADLPQLSSGDQILAFLVSLPGGAESVYEIASPQGLYRVTDAVLESGAEVLDGDGLDSVIARLHGLPLTDVRAIVSQAEEGIANGTVEAESFPWDDVTRIRESLGDPMVLDIPELPDTHELILAFGSAGGCYGIAPQGSASSEDLETCISAEVLQPTPSNGALWAPVRSSDGLQFVLGLSDADEVTLVLDSGESTQLSTNPLDPEAVVGAPVFAGARIFATSTQSSGGQITDVSANS